MNPPAHILLAAQHADPYAYYARLREGPPVVFDAAARVWVVVGPAAVRLALSEPALRVRPVDEPVPRALVGTGVGEVFAMLVRMNDGAFHATHRPPLAARVAAWTPQAVAEAASAAALDSLDRRSLDDWLSAVPVQAVARLLAVPTSALDATVDAVLAFVRGIAPGADAVDVARADEAVALLMAQGARLGLDRVASAQRMALMQQSLDATAGLIGNGLARLAALGPGTACDDMASLVDAVARDDPAIHHTRRWAARPLVLEGVRIGQGSALVVLLAGTVPFGAGPHACPGERVARRLASAALDVLQRAGQKFMPSAPPRRWRPLANARIPVFNP